MLSAAHVLAMDAKNLLDVVDSVRIRYPDLFSVESAQRMAAPKQCEASDEFYFKNSDEYDAEQMTSDHLSSFPNASSTSGAINYNDNCIEQQQTYQNLCKSFEQQPPPTTFVDEIYVNQIEPINATATSTANTANTTSSSEGIYDNECIVNAQLKNLHIDSRIANSFANTSSATVNQPNKVTPPISSTKPPLAAKPGKILRLIKLSAKNYSLFILSFQLNRVIYSKRS